MPGAFLPRLVSGESEISYNRANNGRLLVSPRCFAPSKHSGQLWAAWCSESSKSGAGVPGALVASLRPPVQRAAEFDLWWQVIKAFLLRCWPLLCPQLFLRKELSRITDSFSFPFTVWTRKRGGSELKMGLDFPPWKISLPVPGGCEGLVSSSGGW